VKGYSKIYIASSFTMADKGNYTCASDPTIDNYVRFCGCDIVHDGYECNRQDKIKSICDYAKKKKMQIPLRVCWESTEGTNCCVCEKCFRTMLAIYAEKQHPADFGFGEDKREISALFNINDAIFANGNFKDSRYHCVWDRMHENYTKREVEPCLRWFYNTNITALVKRFKNKDRNERLIRKLKRAPRRILAKIRGEK